MVCKKPLLGSGPAQHGHRRDHSRYEAETSHVILQADPAKNGGITRLQLQYAAVSVAQYCSAFYRFEQQGISQLPEAIHNIFGDDPHLLRGKSPI